MSTTIHENESFKVTQFYGGDERGPCLQVSMEEMYDPTLIGAAQFDLADAIELYNVLGSWIKTECERRQKILREELQELKNVEKTIFHEIAHLNSALIANNTIAAEFIVKFAPVSKRGGEVK